LTPKNYFRRAVCQFLQKADDPQSLNASTIATCNMTVSSPSRPLPYQAVVYENDSTEPLLNDQSSAMGSTSIRIHSHVVSGFVVGVLIQLSTLYANHVFLSLWGKAIFESFSHRSAILIVILWSILTTILALASFDVAHSCLYSGNMGKDRRSVVQFIDGGLVGASTAWVVSDFASGVLSTAMVGVFLILGSVALWCRIKKRRYPCPCQAAQSMDDLDATMIV
jgi:F0F1-type ATP synthase assembly protein I